MSLTPWRKVVKLAAKEFACFLMATDDKKHAVTLEAMLGCRNPDDEPEDRTYFGWHVIYHVEENEVIQSEVITGSCRQLGLWNREDLTDEEKEKISEHLKKLTSEWQQKIEQLGLEYSAGLMAQAANQ